MLQDIASIKKLHDYRISTTIIQSPCFTNLRPYCLYYPSVTGYGPIKVANARQKRLVSSTHEQVSIEFVIPSQT